MRDVNDIIAEWLGWTRKSMTDYGPITVIDYMWEHPDGSRVRQRNMPKWKTSDADAISLLPELVKRGYDYNISSDGDLHKCHVLKVEKNAEGIVVDIKLVAPSGFLSSLSLAITSAVTKLIEEGRS